MRSSWRICSNKSTGASHKVGDELSLQLLLMCSATFLNCQSYPGSIDISSGHPGAPSFLLRARLGKEEFGQANFDADVLPEPTLRLEIVKHVTGYGKILSERDLKLEMAPQEVISTERHIGLRDRDRQSGDDKSAVCGDLLASPRLLYANGGKKKRARIIAQEGLDIVRGVLRQRIVSQDSGKRGARRIDHLERTVAVGMERCVGDQIEKQPLKASRKLSKSLGPAALSGVGG